MFKVRFGLRSFEICYDYIEQDGSLTKMNPLVAVSDDLEKAVGEARRELLRSFRSECFQIFSVSEIRRENHTASHEVVRQKKEENI